MTKRKATAAVMLAAVFSIMTAQAQSFGYGSRTEIRQLPFSNNYGVYRNGTEVQQIRQMPFSNDYGVYNNGLKTQEIRQMPFSNNYEVIHY